LRYDSEDASARLTEPEAFALAAGELLDDELLDDELPDDELLLAGGVEEELELHAAAPSKTHATASNAGIREVMPRT
jgi:hypothetical protein